MLDIYDFYDKMERNKIMLSFKGVITSELLSSILQIMEAKLDHLHEPPKTKRKVFNVLVECLQNLYHHIDETPGADDFFPKSDRSAIFMISREETHYSILTGNFIHVDNVVGLRNKIDEINGMEREELRAHYKAVLNNGEMSAKGGGGLGIIDIARKSGEKLEYSFMPVDTENSFFTLNVKIAPNKEKVK